MGTKIGANRELSPSLIGAIANLRRGEKDVQFNRESDPSRVRERKGVEFVALP
jgi:hypothetical protein